MNLDLSYRGHSELVVAERVAALKFVPNLARERVAFDGVIEDPIRFREAISALHEVVVGDLRFDKDRAAYEQWKAEQTRSEQDRRQALLTQYQRDELERLDDGPPPPELEVDFRRLHAKYWRERRRWADELSREDPALFRHLVPCDPVATVAPDVLFWECFAKDEASYGCLYADRGGLRTAGDVRLGTTNVDYSLALFDHFQTMRTYRETRLVGDPSGFDVEVRGHGNHREQKIDLPPSWLRVNHKPGVARREVRRLRAILHQARTTGLAAQNREGRADFPAWLRGKIAYVTMIDRPKGEALLAELDALPR